VRECRLALIRRGNGDALALLKTVHTSRLKLEPLKASHAGALFHGLQNAALYEFISERPPESVEALRLRYGRLESRVSPDGRDAWLNWVLRTVPDDGHAGWIQATVHPDRTALVAYVLFREAWGRGYAREAVAALIAHLRDDWDIALVRATVDTRNRRSIALLEALGFARGAVRVDAEEIGGVMTDEVEYSLGIG